MSHIQNYNQFIEQYGRQHMNLCKGMEMLAEKGTVVIEAVNIDEKGYGWTFGLKLEGEKSPVWFRYCPFCGEKVFNLLTGDTKCLNPDLPENRLEVDFKSKDRLFKHEKAEAEALYNYVERKQG